MTQYRCSLVSSSIVAFVYDASVSSLLSVKPILSVRTPQPRVG